MKRFAILLVVILLCGASAAAEDSSIFRDAGILPSFWQYLRLGTDDGLVVSNSVDDPLLTFDFNATYSMGLHEEHWDVSLGNRLELDLEESFDESYASNASWASVTYYLTELLPFPLQVFAEGYVEPGVMTTEPGESLIDQDEPGVTLYANWCAGIGLGRLVDVTPVAVVLRMAENLGLDLSRKQVIDIARIVAKRGEYQYRYRGRVDETYYGDIAAALGMEEEALAVRRALRDTSTVSTRRVGWSLRIAGYCQEFADTELQDPSLRITADVGIPLGLSMQLSPYLFEEWQYGGSAVTVEAGTRLSWDRGAAWNQYLDAWIGIYPNTASSWGMDLGYGLRAGTRVQIYDRLYLSLESRLAGAAGYSPLLGGSLNFWYYIF